MKRVWHFFKSIDNESNIVLKRLTHTNNTYSTKNGVECCKALNSLKFTPRHVSIHQHILSRPASTMLVTMLPSQSCYFANYLFFQSSIFVFNNSNPLALWFYWDSHSLHSSDLQSLCSTITTQSQIMLFRLSLFLVTTSSILDSAPFLFNNRNSFFPMIQTIPSMASTEI